MNEEIMKLARDEALKIYGDPLMQFCDPEKKLIVAIYRAAYNKAIGDAARVAYGTGDEQMEQQIRALEMK